MDLTFELPSAPVAAAIAQHREDDWLLFMAELGAAPAPAHEQLLGMNATLAGAAKFVLAPDLRVVLRAEIPGDEPRFASHAELKAATIEGLSVAQYLWRESAATVVASQPTLLEPPSELVHGCADAGWEATPRAGFGLVVEIGRSGNSRAARVQSRADGTTLLAADVVTSASVPEESRRALAQFLLLIGGLLRWARPVVNPPGAEFAASFQIIVPGVPTSAELHDALCILAVAGEVWGDEAAALLHVHVARDYLAATTSFPFPPSHINQ